jgi:hypothetical protein
VRLTLVLLLVGVATLVGCAGPDGDDPELIAADGGFDAEELPSQPLPDDLCAAFVERVCGPGRSTCLDSAACQAALLIDTYEPDRCGEGLEDTFVYPGCEADACTRLVDKVCGESLSCSDSGGCQQAQSLDAQLNDPSFDDDDRNAARDACAAGLVDDLVFAPCSQPP